MARAHLHLFFDLMLNSLHITVVIRACVITASNFGIYNERQIANEHIEGRSVRLGRLVFANLVVTRKHAKCRLAMAGRITLG